MQFLYFGKWYVSPMKKSYSEFAFWEKPAQQNFCAGIFEIEIFPLNSTVITGIVIWTGVASVLGAVFTTFL